MTALESAHLNISIRNNPGSILAFLASAWLAGPLHASDATGAVPDQGAQTPEPGVGQVQNEDRETHGQTLSQDPGYRDRVQPVFDRRCIACHGCLGSPCNLKLDSYAGAERGAFGVNPYANRLGPAPRTDMDAQDSLAAWRRLGFFPVVGTSAGTRGAEASAALDNSLLYLLIDAAREQNRPGFSRQSLRHFRQPRFKATCPPTPAALARRLREFPQLGMPYGLPALSDEDFTTLRDWIAAGAPGPTAAEQQQAREVANAKAVATWEAFFNRPDKRQALVSRFIFDHVFLATIVLEESPGDRFRLVRSKTPPPTPSDVAEGPAVPPRIELIGTGLPYQNPYEYAGVDRFWYRLEKITAAPVQKNLFLWRLNRAELAKLQQLFFAEPWPEGGDLDPPWDVGNPFEVFAAIPAEVRYRFLLEYADVIVGGITYGPVCNGQTATYAVKDQFWVFFLDPAHDPSVQDPALGLETWDVFMDRSALGNAAYRKAYAEAEARLSPNGWSIDAIYDGGGENPNAWLTVLRHETNVSMLRGARGGLPRTFWLIGYSGLERMYYDTVASFEYWGGDPSKLETLLFFNFLRQEFEDNFLLLLPSEVRGPIRHEWTQGIGSIGLLMVPFAGAAQPTAIDLNGKNPLLALLGRIAQHLGPRISQLPDRLNPRLAPPKAASGDPLVARGSIDSLEAWEAALARLTAPRGASFMRHLPSVVVLRLRANAAGDGGAAAPSGETEDAARKAGAPWPTVYSLVVNRAYKSQYTLLFENGQALPDQDTISLYPGLVNGFPNLFIDLDLAESADFLRDLQSVASESDWEELTVRWGVLRNDARFWDFYDWLNQWNRNARGQAAGWLDLSYYDAPEI